jgi:hypothetical protein
LLLLIHSIVFDNDLFGIAIQIDVVVHGFLLLVLELLLFTAGLLLLLKGDLFLLAGGLLSVATQVKISKIGVRGPRILGRRWRGRGRIASAVNEGES